MTTAEMRDEDGKLPAFAWPGGYQIIYFDKENNVLCPACANKPEGEYSAPVVAGDIFWEGAPIQCDDCGAEIESAYGDPDAEDEAASTETSK